MTEWLDQLSLFMSGAMLMLSALELWFALIMPSASRWNRRFFIAIFTILLLCMGAGIVDLLTYRHSGMAWAQRISIYFEYLLITLPMPLFTVYLLGCCGENWRKSALWRAVLALWLVFFILLGVAQFTTFLYHVAPENEFCRGPWHPLLMAFAAASMILNLAGVIRRRNRLPGKYYAAFLVYLFPLTVSWLVHTVVFVPQLVFIGVVFSALAMVGIILSDQMEQYMRQQREIAHQRANIMVLQMRPHFIYNAMTSIYYLCDQDPQEAKHVTMDFTAYLRRNFTAIASRDPIPFSDELEHTRAYLTIEQVQFKDSLFVDYDTPHTGFRVPPLTLQPIVENAVKHGMDPESEPLRISIRTRRTEAGSEIIVEDNGPGFASAATDESEPHIALANIQQRLEMMCGGKMTIMPREGEDKAPLGGTVVKVTIP
ncbi:MAG: histidine kinase [Synergistaceae bacterium]|nr:histidine kinase [Synergistaceae bacterium]